MTKSKANTRNRIPPEKFNFLHRVNADKTLSFAAKTVMVELLTTFHNHKTGQCDPGYDGLAKAAGCSRPTAISAVRELEGTGWVSVKRTNGGSSNHRNHYSFDFGAVNTSLPVKNSAKLVKTSLHEPIRTTLPTGESVCVASLIPTGAHLTVRQGEWKEERKQESGSPTEGKEERKELVEEPKFQFEQLCEVWQKPDGIDRGKALKAFEAVCSEYIDPEDSLLESAAAWVGTVEPRYLPKLELWLANGAWLKDPPARRRNGYHRKPTASEAAMDLSRWYASQGR